MKMSMKSGAGHLILLSVFILMFSISCNNNSAKNDDIRQNIYNITNTLTGTDSIQPFFFTNDEPKLIRVPEKPIEDFFPSQLINIHWYISLETNKNSLFGDIEKIKIRDNKIFILDGFKESIVIFDINGTFENKIDNTGNGPYEYYRISDFEIKGNNIIILDDIRDKLFTFTMDGVCIGVKDMAVKFSNFRFLPDESLFMYTASQANEFIPAINNYEWLIGYPDSIITNAGFLRDEARTRMRQLTFPRSLTDYNDTVIFIPKFGQHVYEVTENKMIKPRYIVDFKKPVTEAALEGISMDDMGRSLVENGYEYISAPWLETEYYIYFSSTHKEGNLRSFVYSKKKDKTIAYEGYFTGYETEYAFIMYSTPITNHNNMFVSVLQSNKILKNKKGIIKKNQNNPEVLNIINNLKDDDNPVLMLFDINPNSTLFD